jgi:hypothetical protein
MQPSGYSTTGTKFLLSCFCWRKKERTLGMGQFALNCFSHLDVPPCDSSQFALRPPDALIPSLNLGGWVYKNDPSFSFPFPCVLIVYLFGGFYFPAYPVFLIPPSTPSYRDPSPRVYLSCFLPGTLSKVRSAARFPLLFCVLCLVMSCVYPFFSRCLPSPIVNEEEKVSWPLCSFVSSYIVVWGVFSVVFSVLVELRDLVRL